MKRITTHAAAKIPSNTIFKIPRAFTKTNVPGENLCIYMREMLRTCGTVANGDDYEEVDDTHVRFFVPIQAGDPIDYLYLEDIAPQQ